MTTLTRERLEQIANFHSQMILPPSHAEIEELARIALAAMQQEPVAYIRAAHRADGFCYADGIHDKKYHDQHPLSLLRNGDYWVVTPLYAAPAVPVSAPEWTNEQCMEFLSIAFRHAEINGDLQLDDIRLGMKMVNGSRDAMLQGKAEPVSNRDELNSPVIMDGWISCSERMPEDEQEVLTRNRMGHCFVSFFDEHSGLFFDRVDVAAACCIEHILVTHWMPLPAAPQQEVK